MTNTIPNNDPHYRHAWGDTVYFLSENNKLLQGIVTNSWTDQPDREERGDVYLVVFEGMDLVLDASKLIYPNLIDELLMI